MVQNSYEPSLKVRVECHTLASTIILGFILVSCLDFCLQCLSYLFITMCYSNIRQYKPGPAFLVSMVTFSDLPAIPPLKPSPVTVTLLG